MSKSQSIFMCIYWCFLVIGCQKNSKDLQKYNLKGPVREVTTKRYIAVEKFGEVTKGEIEPPLRKDDPRYFTYYWPYRSNNTIYFDENGRLTVCSLFDRSQNTRIKIEYENDTVTNFFDEYGLKVKIISNNKQQSTLENWYDGDGDLIVRMKGEYDNDKQLPVHKAWYNKDGAERANMVMEYDTKGRLTNITIEEKQSRGGNFRKVYAIEYNDNNTVRSVTTDEQDESTWVGMNYEFDEYGNWITCIENNGMNPTYVIERKLTYFE